MSASGARWPADPDDGAGAGGSDWLDEPTSRPPVRGSERRIQVIRRIDPWSVLKFSLVLYFSVFLVFLAAGVGLWLAASAGGMIDNFEGLIEELAYPPDVYHANPDYILRTVAVVGPILVVLASLATVVGVALFNLAARLIGGIEMTVSDETDRR